MSTKTFNLVKACVAGAETIAVAVVTYCTKDAGVAAAVNSSIIVLCAAAVQICENFVKE